jgi:predicted DCC family thiol-disulfide oxidoreductase YuxK
MARVERDPSPRPRGGPPGARPTAEGETVRSLFSGPILFYDGECGLCAASVQWCLEHERSGTLRFAPLQGSTYAALQLADKPSDALTVVLFERGRLLVRSDAAIALLRKAGGAWPALALALNLVPRGLRDGGYRFVARRRHAWFARPGRCRLPTAQESARFLA